MGCDSTAQSRKARCRRTRRVRPGSVPSVSFYASTLTHLNLITQPHPHRNAHAQPTLTAPQPSTAGYTGVYDRYGRGRAGHSKIFSAEPAHPYRAEYKGRHLGTFPTKLKAAVAYARARQLQSAPGQQLRRQQSDTWQRPRQRASTVSPSYSVTGDGGTGAEASAEEEDGDEFIDSIRIRAQEQPPMSNRGGEEEEQGEQEEQEEWYQFVPDQQQQYLQQQQQQQQRLQQHHQHHQHYQHQHKHHHQNQRPQQRQQQQTEDEGEEEELQSASRKRRADAMEAEPEVESEPEPKYLCRHSITGFILCTLPLHHEGDHKWQTNGREYSAPRSAKELKQLPSRQRPRPQPQPPLPHQLPTHSQPPPPKSTSQPSTSQPVPRQPELSGDPPTGAGFLHGHAALAPPAAPVVPTEFMEVLEYVRSKVGLPHGTATHVAAEANKVVGLPFTGKESVLTQLRRLAVSLTDE